jgi:hypothetical protein
MIDQLQPAIDITRLIVVLAKIGDCTLSALIAIIIKRRSKYILNTLFSFALIGWAIYIGTDTILYQIAPISLLFFNIANMLRDIGMIGISIVPLCYIFAAFLIRDGEEITFHQKRKRLVLAFVVNFAIIMGVIMNDSIMVYQKNADGTKTLIDPATLPPTVPYSVNFDSVSLWGRIAFIFYLSYVAWYVAAIYLMFIVQKRESGVEKQRAIYIMIGILMIPSGIVYYVLLGTFKVPPDIYAILDILGHIIWMLSPIMIYLSLRLQQSNVKTAIPATEIS